ncbi:hypothetical protein PR202_ga28456 [Eleusine coracana subsp. coracana]|uniref:RNase H type-1 domain-containing protein n=1 Tax=Eleusine coracana subsp. coracana TaxID=191504 RepID=A0AAV5DIL5_ELECO|nr:hypothetical protein PR202_ga28456 [Eleusine coracana subsp. coracana]
MASEGGGRRTDARHKLTWIPPSSGWAKVNVDGAFSSDTRRGGVGVIIRDKRGAVILTAWRVIFQAASAEEVETLACTEGLNMATEWVRDRVVLESDCSELVRALERKGTPRSNLCFQLDEIRRLCNRLPGVEFRAIRREQNCVAHELAQLAKRTTHTAMWRARSPCCIEQLVAQECNLCSE